MRDVLLVAAREFRQTVATRGFWIMLLIVPLAIGASIFASAKLAPTSSVAFAVVDHSGRFADRLEERLDRDYQRQVLRELSTYVERHKLVSVDPDAPWARRGSWLVDGEVERFTAQGGVDAALNRLRPALPEDAADVEAPDRPDHRIEVPANVPADQGHAAFGEALAPVLKDDVQTPDGEMPLALGIYIPQNFGAPGVAAQVWTNGRPNAGLLNVVNDELTAGLRLDALQASGLSADAATRIQTLGAPIAVTEPPVGEERGFDHPGGADVSAADHRGDHRLDDAAGRGRGALQQAARIGARLRAASGADERQAGRARRRRARHHHGGDRLRGGRGAVEQRRVR